MLQNTVVVRLNPTRLRNLASIINEVKNDEKITSTLESVELSISKRLGDIEERRNELLHANKSMFQEIRLATRKNPLASFEEQEMDFRKFEHTLGKQNFLYVIFTVIDHLHQIYEGVLKTCNDLRVDDMILTENEINLKEINFEKLQQLSIEADINSPNIERFLSALYSIEDGRQAVQNLSDSILRIVEVYYKMLLHRHTVDGVEIHKNPIATDLAISVFENIDAHGEIESGKKPDEISAYSARKAEVIISTLQNNNIQSFISEPSGFINYIVNSLTFIWNKVSKLTSLFKDTIDKTRRITNRREPSFFNDFEYLMSIFDDLNPENIIYKEKSELLTSEEKISLKFRNETVKNIVKLLSDPNVRHDKLLQYILERKAELREFYQEENSFYICRIGSGNVFLGEAPGALTVVPGTKPNINLDDIIGSGFDNVREFIRTIKASSKWHDLFLATSPSKTADKSNMLLIGPMGCGKTEVMRAVATEKDSIAIFAQGSDFGTCWKGEMEKNPKRLFESAIKLQRESSKHVHILIDEVDSVLIKPELLSHSETNLTLEFQILMDGIVEYPQLSVIAATNSPERIPMPMIRRFSFVSIVGELNNNNRKKLLKQFVNFLPTDNFPERAWDDLANKLEGATGDVIRKVADHVWRTKISTFVQTHPIQAEDLIKFLNRDEKFEVKNFTAKRRKQFKNKLSEYIRVTPADIEQSVDEHLKNVGIHHEIQEAKRVYREAKEFLSRLKSG